MKKILIIEDDLSVANIYRNKFLLEGFEVEVASDGDMGLQLVHSFRPDAVLLELMVPKLPGVELVKKLRSQPAFEKLPVIVFSNTYLTNLVQDAWKAGATKCLSKSNCTPKQVMEVMRSVLPANGTAALALPSETGKTVAGKDADVQFQASLRKSLIEGLPATLSALRADLQGVIKAKNDDFRIAKVRDLYRRIHTLTGNAGMTGLLQIGQMTDALEALLKELHEKPKNINASTLRTIASCIDFLGSLFDSVGLTDQSDIFSPNILVVDDEAISRRAVTHSLEKARLKCVAVEDPVAAYDLLSQTKFDLIFLDVDMPEMNGFELCTKIRTLPAHKKTPVVFVTSLNDFESRANSTMSGGSDFIGKPFLFMELAVKALIYVFRTRLDSTKQSTQQNSQSQSHLGKTLVASASC
jgi:DNA-binding response OmpR family regulator